MAFKHNMANSNVSVTAVPFNPNTQTFGGANITPAAQVNASAQPGVPTAAENLAAYQAQQAKVAPQNIPQSQNISTFGTQPIKLPSGSQQTNTQPTSNYALSGLQNIPTPVSDAASNISSTMLQLIPQLQGQTQELSAQKKALGVDTMRTNLQNLNNQILQKQAELSQQDVALAQGLQNIEDQTIPMEFITGQQMSMEKRANLAKAVKVSQINMLNASALAAQGNIALASDLAQEAVDAKFAPVKEMYTTLQAQLQAIQPLLNAEEKKVAAQQSMMADVQKQLLTIKADQQKNIASLLMQSQANGIDPDTYAKALKAYNSGASDVEVASIIGAYGGKDYLANKDLLDMSRNALYNGSNQLTVDNGFTLDLFKKGIAGVESSNNYKAIGPATSSGDKAYGKYQVMGANIPSWTEEAGLGRMTPQQFLSSPDAQEKVFEFQSMKNYGKYGNWDDVASVWFSGSPLSNNTSSDGYNTVPQYVAKVRTAMGVPAQPTTLSMVTDPNVKLYGDEYLRLGRPQDYLKTLPKYVRPEAVLAYANQNVNNTPQVQSLVDKINSIDTLMNSPYLSSVVGPNFLARGATSNVLGGATTGGVGGAVAGSFVPVVGNLFGALGGAVAGGVAGYATSPQFSGKAASYIGDVELLTSKETIDSLIQAKAQGATFGALSDSEQKMLRDSATKINNWAIKNGDGKVVGYDIDEESFINELNRLKTLAQKGIAKAGGNVLGGTPGQVYANSIIQATSTADTTNPYGFK